MHMLWARHESKGLTLVQEEDDKNEPNSNHALRRRSRETENTASKRKNPKDSTLVEAGYKCVGVWQSSYEELY